MRYVGVNQADFRRSAELESEIMLQPLVHPRHGGVPVGHAVHVPDGKSRLAEAKTDRAFRKPSLRVLDSKKALLLRGRHQLSVPVERRGRIVMPGPDTPADS